ncbi:MAG: ketoacyl-ACP synthase III [Bacteroidia bacterium]
MNAYIKAISYYLPEKIFSNEEFFSIFTTISNKENLEKIGVRERRIVENSVTSSDIAIEAANIFFNEHSIDKSEIDFLLFCSLELDYYTPSTACIIQEKLGLSQHCGALDFNLGCSGYVYGLSIAKGLVETGAAKNILLLTASTLTKKIHPKDKGSRFVFGDGAAATLISGREKKGIEKFIFGTDGKRFEKIIVKDGGVRNPISEKSFIDTTDEYGNTSNSASFYMDGTSVFIFGLKKVPEMVKNLLEKSNKQIEDIDLFIFHQANLYLIEKIREKLKIPEKKIFNYMENCGNTVSSTIPIALYEAIKAGKASPGKNIFLAGFGVGLSWAATIIQL